MSELYSEADCLKAELRAYEDAVTEARADTDEAQQKVATLTLQLREQVNEHVSFQMTNSHTCSHSQASKPRSNRAGVHCNISLCRDMPFPKIVKIAVKEEKDSS